MFFLLFSAATSFAKTPLQPILPLLEAMPSDLHVTVPYLLSFVMGILLSLLNTWPVLYSNCSAIVFPTV